MTNEPLTAATDYLLALVAALLGLLVLRASAGQASRRIWGGTFLALALAAVLGGAHHGFAAGTLWKPTLLVAGLASGGMLAGSVFATTRALPRRALLALAVLKLAAYWLWIAGHDSYAAVIADSALTLLLVAALHARSAEPGSRAMLGGVVLAGFAALAQASGFDLHRGFDHNALYHLIQIAALAFFYQGVRLMTDRRA